MLYDIHIKLDDRSFELLKKLKGERFGTTRRTIERALATLYESTSAEITPADIIFLSHRRQLRMLTLDRPLFSKILAGPTRDYEDYPHVTLLKYMTPKMLKDLTLNEVLVLMNDVYANMFNWFDKIDVDHGRGEKRSPITTTRTRTTRGSWPNTTKTFFDGCTSMWRKLS